MDKLVGTWSAPDEKRIEEFEKHYREVEFGVTTAAAAGWEQDGTNASGSMAE